MKIILSVAAIAKCKFPPNNCRSCTFQHHAICFIRRTVPISLIWCIGNVIGDIPLFYLAKYFFLPMRLSKTYFFIANSVPIFGNASVIAGSGRFSVEKFIGFNFAILFLQNAVIQNICYFLSLDSKTGGYFKNIMVNTWNWSKNCDNAFLRLYYVFKSFMLITLIAQAFVRMIERCAQHLILQKDKRHSFKVE